jgi:hypothetical protein
LINIYVVIKPCFSRDDGHTAFYKKSAPLISGADFYPKVENIPYHLLVSS